MSALPFCLLSDSDTHLLQTSQWLREIWAAWPSRSGLSGTTVSARSRGANESHYSLRIIDTDFRTARRLWFTGKLHPSSSASCSAGNVSSGLIPPPLFFSDL